MLANYVSPLAPAAVLLLGAFLLLIIFPRLPARWQVRPEVQAYGPPGLVGLAILALLGIRLTFGEDAAGAGLELISGWDFSTADSAAALTVRADVLSLAFLILTLLVLLAVTLAAPNLTAVQVDDPPKKGPDYMASWFAMGTGACLVFVAANGLTIGYAVLIFDLFTALYWLQRGYPNLGVGRLFLGIFTAGGLVLVTVNAAPGLLMLGLALWARLGLYPFIETTTQPRWNVYGQLIYVATSLSVGFYLVIRGLAAPLPGVVQWLIVMTMLLNGLLTWLSEQRSSLLMRLVLTQACLILLAEPLVEGRATAAALGLILSLVALRVTPCLGKPQLTERGWPWPYLPAVAATLTLIGFPFSLGWLARVAVYQSIFLFNDIRLILAVMLAEGLALSGLVRYWSILWQGNRRDERRAVAGIVAMVPFLIPGLASFILGTIIRTELSAAEVEPSFGVITAIAVTVAGAVVAGYYRRQILNRANLSPMVLDEFLQLQWLFPGVEKMLDRLGKAILRLRVVLEGRHYLGWTLLVALVGGLIIFLRT